MQLAVFNVLESGDTVFDTVDGQIGVAGRVLFHGLENAAGGWEETCAGVLIGIPLLFQRDLFFIQPLGQFLKGHDRVHNTLVMLGLVLFGHAGADENRLCLRHTALDIRAVGLHGRLHVRQIFQRFRVIFLDQQVDGVAAGGDQNIPLFFLEHPFVFPLDHGSAQRGFLHAGEAQLFQCDPHTVDAHAVIIGGEGGGQTDDDRRAAVEQHLHLFPLIHDLLRVLGADHEALAAQDAFVADDMGLIAGKADGFDRAMPNALIAVFAVGFL